MVTRRSASSVTSDVKSDAEIPDTVSSQAAQPAQSAAGWYDDRHSILLLVLLYAAQGLPVGLAFGSIPFLLKERGSSYAALAQFSFASMPYSLKLIIAPFVDAFYSPSFGRRKSWIVPVQMAIGCVMLFFSSAIHHWVAHGNVAALAPTFFMLIALVATQDIAVDGWSLTMLKKENVAYASTCQSLGLSVGYFATFTIFLAFSNDAFCDKYVRPLMWSASTGALLDLQLALRLVGVFYLLLTAYVTFGKNENSAPSKKSDDASDQEYSDEDSSSSSRSLLPLSALDNIRHTYRDMLVVVRLPAVQALVVALLIAKLGFSAYDNGKYGTQQNVLDARIRRWAVGSVLTPFFSLCALLLCISSYMFVFSLVAQATRAWVFQREYGVHGRDTSTFYNYRDCHHRSARGREVPDCGLSCWVLLSLVAELDRASVCSNVIES
ncbi:Acetyl-coenzyme A transporter 1 [Gracilaria domingensis]|nr:Acetyl-coenzyme A transporter 1 [Gracilaria domingensis]